MPKKNNEQVMKSIFDNFTKYSRHGETLTLGLGGKNVEYNYIRDNQDPSYEGTLHDKQTFAKSALIELINKMLFATSRQASITTKSFKEDFDDSESMYSRGHLGPGPSYKTQLTLELSMVGNLPILRTENMLPLKYLKRYLNNS